MANKEKKKHKYNAGARKCEICGNEIFKIGTVKCPYCGRVNMRVKDKKEMIV